MADMPEISAGPAPTPDSAQCEVMRMGGALQRRQQVSALALEFHRTVSSRFISGIMDGDQGFLTRDEEVCFGSACQHLSAIFRGENE